MNRESAKQTVKDLIEKYERVKSEGVLKDYNEEETKKDFIIPLFSALGWNMHSKHEVTAEELISNDRADYGFYINGRPKFYLEAKKISANLHRVEFADQSIKYAWNKGVTWAVLTDFESIKVFCAQNIDKDLTDKLFFEIPYQDYLERFDQLYLLSKESFETGFLDKEAEKFGKKLLRVSVTEKLARDLNECRELLTKGLSACNEKKQLSRDLIDEGVQKLLDRILFLRVAEDRGIEADTLNGLLRQAKAQYNSKTFFQAMITKFRELDEIYNSNLFSPHPFEEWEEFSGATEEVIKILQGQKGYYEYDFKVMPADVLGQVYESYLGYKLSQSKKGLSVEKDTTKRKEQGIYYTPVFIVDYIVKNSLKPILDRCNSVEDLQKIKILDPACGSGSFLIRALEVILDKYKEFGDRGGEFTKLQILTRNIYGVDFDQQAVEIARLNLLINALDTRMKMPGLDKNIKYGNSLTIDWKEEFPEVFKQGGFDVIIGNPPYIKEFINKGAFDDLHDSPYYQGKMDIWTMFGCISIDLLKNGGVVGFIAPNNWISNAGASIFRDKILTDGELRMFIDFGDYKVFDQASIQTMIYVFEKKQPSNKYSIDYIRIIDKNITEENLVAEIINKKTKIEVEPKNFLGQNITFTDTESGSIFDKLEKKRNFELADKEVGQGIVSPQEYVIGKHLPYLIDAKIGKGIFVLTTEEVRDLNFTQVERKLIKPFYSTEEISRYFANDKNKLWIIYSNKEVTKNINKYPQVKRHLEKYTPVITSDFGPFGLHRARDEKLFIGPSIFSIRKTGRPQFSHVNFHCYVSQTYFVISTNRIDLKYLTGLFNSGLIYFWLKNKGKLQGDMLQIDKGPLMNIPIYVGNKIQQKQIIDLVDKMLSLNKDLDEIPENSEKWLSVKSEIEKTDKKIDQEVYKLYGLTENDVNIVEDSLK